MSANPDAAMPNEAATPDSPSNNLTPRKPRLALFIATACGLGYMPVAPGTWGSVAGVGIWFLSVFYFPLWLGGTLFTWTAAFPFTTVLYALVLAAGGVWASDRAAKFTRAKDPQFVVIDEVSGQYLALMLGLPLGYATHTRASGSHALWLSSDSSYLSLTNGGLKYALLGFILFRVFDIWKPFPARQAESLPGGWGIMADDWVAGIYAAIGLWIARAAGL
jgi:phosphatidylglycerophosphatase A